jgi:hypothetical protein
VSGIAVVECKSCWFLLLSFTFATPSHHRKRGFFLPFDAAVVVKEKDDDDANDGIPIWELWFLLVVEEAVVVVLTIIVDLLGIWTVFFIPIALFDDNVFA